MRRLLAERVLTATFVSQRLLRLLLLLVQNVAETSTRGGRVDLRELGEAGVDAH